MVKGEAKVAGTVCDILCARDSPGRNTYPLPLDTCSFQGARKEKAKSEVQGSRCCHPIIQIPPLFCPPWSLGITCMSSWTMGSESVLSPGHCLCSGPSHWIRGLWTSPRAWCSQRKSTGAGWEHIWGSLPAPQSERNEKSRDHPSCLRSQWPFSIFFPFC